MSPSWHRRLFIGLAPSGVDLLRLERGWPVRRLERVNLPLAQSGQPPWSAALEAFEALLDERGWQRHGLHFILSGHFSRLAVLPGGEAIGPAERLDLARLIFRQHYGELAHDWALRVSPAAAGTAPVACGVPSALLEALRTAADGRGLLRSIQPALMAVFNRVRRRLDGQDGTLALIEPGRLTFARLTDGQWQDIASRAGDGAQLPELLGQSRTLAGLPTGGRLWLCPLSDAALPALPAAWQVTTLGAGEPGLAAWASV